MQLFCRLVMKNSFFGLIILQLDPLIWETASPMAHKPKIVNKSLYVMSH